MIAGHPQYRHAKEAPPPAAKSEMLTVRVLLEVKIALRQAAEREHRSPANMLEAMIRAYVRSPGEGAARTPTRPNGR